MRLPEPISGWYAGLAARERHLVIACAIVVALLIVYLAAVQPLMSAHHSLGHKLRADRSLLAYMNGAAGRLKSAPPGAGTGRLTGSVFSAVSAATKDASIHDAVQRLEQADNGGVRLTFTAVPFDALVKWLQRLADRKGITAISASIQGAQSPGTVNATLELNTRA